jgi:hypothetical protein
MQPLPPLSIPGQIRVISVSVSLSSCCQHMPASMAVAVPSLCPVIHLPCSARASGLRRPLPRGRSARIRAAGRCARRISTRTATMKWLGRDRLPRTYRQPPIVQNRAIPQPVRLPAIACPRPRMRAGALPAPVPPPRRPPGVSGASGCSHKVCA